MGGPKPFAWSAFYKEEENIIPLTLSNIIYTSVTEKFNHLKDM